MKDKIEKERKIKDKFCERRRTSKEKPTRNKSIEKIMAKKIKERETRERNLNEVRKRYLKKEPNTEQENRK